VTWDCNFACVHCYLGSQRTDEEIGTASALRLLDQAAGSGCLGISFTGGEPLLREDFPVLLRHAVSRGFLVTLFTNGSLVDESTAEELAAHPPRCIEVSLYGADAEGYRRVTGAAAHFTQVMHGLDALQAHGLQVVLKAVLLEPVLLQAPALISLARQRGLKLRLDPNVDPTLDGDASPLRLRPDPDAAVEVELLAAGDARLLADFDREQRACRNDEAACGAGRSSFHVDPLGRMMPCLLLREPAVSALELGFAGAWESLAAAPAPQFDSRSPCRGCEQRHLCGHCPGLEHLGARPRVGGYPCRVASARRKALQSCGGGA
jgi:radical SAM protein with 4Fe4S-binding SPASM domain